MENDLCQLVIKPTRGNNILYIFFAKESDDSVKCDIIPYLIASDHECLQTTFSYYECIAKLTENNFTYNYNFRPFKGNFLALNNSFFSINWYYHFLCFI